MTDGSSHFVSYHQLNSTIIAGKMSCTDRGGRTLMWVSVLFKNTQAEEQKHQAEFGKRDRQTSINVQTDWGKQRKNIISKENHNQNANMSNQRFGCRKPGS